MKTKRDSTSRLLQTRGYWGADVPMAVIRRYARRVAERFHPEKIILFGSYAYGKPNADSDVDVLVVMPARNQLDQSFKIRLELPAPFAMDLLVCTPKNIAWRMADGDSFLREIFAKGEILYEKDDPRMDQKGGRRLGHRKRKQPKQNRLA